METLTRFPQHARTDDRPPAPDGLLSSRETADDAGVTYRQLDYWCRAGIVLLAQTANGSGTRRRFDPSEVRIIRAIDALMRLGMTTDEAGLAVAELRYLPADQWTGPWITAGRILSLDTLRG